MPKHPSPTSTSPNTDRADAAHDQSSKPPDPPFSEQELLELATQIKSWGHELGFNQIGITDTELGQHEQYLQHWLELQHHGEMDYMQRHGTKRSRPTELVPGTLRIISARMDYLPPETGIFELLNDSNKAFISRYALGRDYHKLMRKRLASLAKKISAWVGDFQQRAFVDSAPVLEKAIAEKSGLGWIGKHTLLINRQAGSWFFLGELYTNLPLPIDEPTSSHCGKCTACIDVCPTGAIVRPYELDSRKCISYLTIELKGPIPEPYRSPMGNRVFGCDDCQLVCPWNRFARPTREKDFLPRHNLDNTELVTLFLWDEATFMRNTEGSAIRRIGYQRWLRNLAVGLGNAPYSEAIVSALEQARVSHAQSELVLEHIDWALKQQYQKARFKSEH